MVFVDEHEMHQQTSTFFGFEQFACRFATKFLLGPSRSLESDAPLCKNSPKSNSALRFLLHHMIHLFLADKSAHQKVLHGNLLGHT